MSKLAKTQSAEPRIPWTHWQSTGELMQDLLLGITPRPFWIVIDRYSTRVSDENCLTIGRGLLLAIEFDLAKEAK